MAQMVLRKRFEKKIVKMWEVDCSVKRKPCKRSVVLVLSKQVRYSSGEGIMMFQHDEAEK